MKIPCKECISLAICRVKEFEVIVEDCSIIDKLLYEPIVDDNHLFIMKTSTYNQTVEAMEEVMNPVEWKVDYRGQI